MLRQVLWQVGTRLLFAFALVGIAAVLSAMNLRGNASASNNLRARASEDPAAGSPEFAREAVTQLQQGHAGAMTVY